MKQQKTSSTKTPKNSKKRKTPKKHSSEPEKNIKIAAALIVKGADDEAVHLDRCLGSIAEHVDKVFITITQPNENVEKVAKSYGAEISHFEWCNDYAKARNFNFSQVPKEYQYIFWCDADDTIIGMDKLRPTIESYPEVDAFNFYYIYDYDSGLSTVVHTKTQVVKNGCVEWVGEVHEDFKPLRELRTYLVNGIKRLHHSNDDRAKKSAERNLEIAKEMLDKKPNDPRSHWNLANAYIGTGDKEHAIEWFTKFLKTSASEDEKFIARLRLADLDQENALEHIRIAIGMKPFAPDGYISMGQYAYNKGNFPLAEKYLLDALQKKPDYSSMIVYNPRDYDFNPLMLLAKTYYSLNRPDMALICLESCKDIDPDSKEVKDLIKKMKVFKEEFDKVTEIIQKLQKTPKSKLKAALEKVPKQLKSHPAVCHLRNTNFIKEKSSGKDLVIYCYPTSEEWTPDTLSGKGIGGSEEAVIHLSRELSELGWNVTVYNNCGYKPQKFGNVWWKPFWEWNYRDKQDVFISWRIARPFDYEINATKKYMDVHDAIPAGEFTDERLKKIDKIFVKTKFHRSLYPNVPDEKFAIIPNGLDTGLFDQKVEKDQYLMVNTSSPERSMDVLPKLFEQVKKRVPQARMKWAYGWNVWDSAHASNEGMMNKKKEIINEMKHVGIENLGRVSQNDAARLYLEASVLAYPTEFAEIDCITVKKAQAAGCLPVATDFGALAESIRFGDKIHSKKTKYNWAADYRLSFGLDDEEGQKQWVDACVHRLLNPVKDREPMIKWAKETFNWKRIANLWNDELC